jgi:branched-chain amino acid transport system substrate-binding protein
MNKIFLFTIVITLFMQLTSCDRQQPVQPSGKKIKIGVIGPFSGSYKHIGEDGLNGIRTVLLMQPYLNNGDGIDLVTVDDQNEPELTVQALKKLSENDNVSAILIFSTSASMLAVNAIADDYRIPVLALLASHQDIAKNTSFVSQLCFDNLLQGMVAALYVMDELLINRVAVFKDPDSFHSTSLADEFIRKYESLGGEVTDIIPAGPGTEITEGTLDVIRKNGADLLYLPISAEQVISISTTTEEMGWKPEQMGSDGLLFNVLRQYDKELEHLDGLFAIDLYAEDEPLTSFGRKADTAYRKLYDNRPSTFAAAGADAMAILMQTMNRCSKPGNRECINSMLHDTQDFEGLTGKISIKSNGKAVRPLIVNTIKNGRTKFVVKVY